MFNYEGFAEKLLAARKSSKLPIKDFLEEIGVTRQQYNRYELGKSLPPLDKLKLLCDKFEVTINDLVYGAPLSPKSLSIDYKNTDSEEFKMMIGIINDKEDIIKLLKESNEKLKSEIEMYKRLLIDKRDNL